MNETISFDVLDKVDSELRKIGYQFVKNIGNDKLVFKRELIPNSKKELVIDLKIKGFSLSYGNQNVISLTCDEIKTFNYIMQILNW